MYCRSCWIPVLAALVPAALSAQALRLEDALRQADRSAYPNRIADGQAREAASRRTAALQGILPTLRFEGGWTRTNDPLNAFGLALRQRSVAQSDFDPARLNDPPAISNYGAAAVLEVPVLVPEAHLGRVAATRGAAAAEAQAEWSRVGTRVEVIRAFYGAVLAREKVATLERGAEAASAHVRQADAMARNGLVTRSDALLASVRAGELDADLLGARADAATARAGLALLLGTPGDTAAALPARLPGVERLAVLAADSAATRADVRAAGLGLEASRADLRRARSLLLPRVVAMGRYDWSDPDTPFGTEGAWAAGLMVQWAPFSGGRELAEQQAARGRLSAAEAGAEAARGRAALEADRATRGLQVALQRLEIAARGAEQAAEAHRIVERKYAGGLAGVVELLDAAAAETRAALGRSHAVYQVIVAAAERLQATGRDPARLASLDS